MAVLKAFKNKDGTTSIPVRVGRTGQLRTFNTKDYGGSRKLAKAAAHHHNSELLAGGPVVKSVTCAAYTDRFLVLAEREPTKRTGTSRKAGSVAQLRTSANGFKR